MLTYSMSILRSLLRVSPLDHFIMIVCDRKLELLFGIVCV